MVMHGCISYTGGFLLLYHSPACVLNLRRITSARASADNGDGGVARAADRAHSILRTGLWEVAPRPRVPDRPARALGGHTQALAEHTRALGRSRPGMESRCPEIH